MAQRGPIILFYPRDFLPAKIISLLTATVPPPSFLILASPPCVKANRWLVTARTAWPKCFLAQTRVTQRATPWYSISYPERLTRSLPPPASTSSGGPRSARLAGQCRTPAQTITRTSKTCLLPAKPFANLGKPLPQDPCVLGATCCPLLSDGNALAMIPEVIGSSAFFFSSKTAAYGGLLQTGARLLPCRQRAGPNREQRPAHGTRHRVLSQQ